MTDLRLQVKFILLHKRNKTHKNSFKKKEKKKRNLNTKRHIMQNDQNADTTLLHSNDDLS